MMNRRRRLALALGMMMFLAYIVYRGAQHSNDFRHQYGAARQLWETGVLHLKAQPRYPLPMHVLLAPLSALPLAVATGVWALISFAAIAALPGVLARLSGIEPRQQRLAWLVVAVFFIDALVLAQSDPINIFLVTSGLVAAKEGRGTRGAFLIGLAGMIKLLPIVQWAGLLARKRTWDVWAGMAATGVLGVALVVSVAGWGPGLNEIKAQIDWLRNEEKPWHLVARGSDLRPNNESLPIVLARTFGDLPSEVRTPHMVSLTRFPLDQIWRAWALILAVLGIAWLASIGPASRVASERGWLGMFALTSIVMLASTPVAWHHYFLWTLPAALFLIERRRLLVSIAVISLIVTIVPEARALGGHMALALGLFGIVVYDLRRESSQKSARISRSDSVDPYRE